MPALAFSNPSNMLSPVRAAVSRVRRTARSRGLFDELGVCYALIKAEALRSTCAGEPAKFAIPGVVLQTYW